MLPRENSSLARRVESTSDRRRAKVIPAPTVDMQKGPESHLRTLRQRSR